MVEELEAAASSAAKARATALFTARNDVTTDSEIAPAAGAAAAQRAISRSGAITPAITLCQEAVEKATRQLPDIISTSLMAARGMRGDEVDEFGRNRRGEFAYEA